jgi:hypothetical protein
VRPEALTDEQRQLLESIKGDPMRRLVFGTYRGETCQGCGKTINTFQEMTDAVWWPHEKGRIGHKRCFDAARKEVQP